MIFDPESNIMCIELASGQITHAREFGNFIVHMGKTGKPIMIEILEASSFINQFNNLKNIKDIKKVLPVN